MIDESSICVANPAIKYTFLGEDYWIYLGATIHSEKWIICFIKEFMDKCHVLFKKV